MNDNWRLMAALFLTIIVLMVWSYFFSPAQKKMQGNKTQTTVAEQKKQSSKTIPDKGPQKTQSQVEAPQGTTRPTYLGKAGEKVTVDTPLYRAIFNSQGGILLHFWLKNYKSTIKKGTGPIDLISKKSLKKAPMGILWKFGATWKDADWKVSGENVDLKGGQKDSIIFKGRVEGVSIVRKLIFSANSYEIREKTKVINQTSKRITGPIGLSLASTKLVSNENRFNTTEVSYYLNQSVVQEDDKDTLKKGVDSQNPVQWGGIESNYFILSVIPRNNNMFFKGAYDQDVYRVAIQRNLSIGANSQKGIASSYYMGPKVKNELSKAPNHLIAALNYGWFNIIAKPLMSVLKYFHNYVGNYGVAIILLTIVIKIVFWPLSHKSFKSMEQMKKLQPMMQKLKEQYKDDRQTMNQELMKLYKTYKVNPAGGCLPMLLQIPVFIGLYEALLGSVELRHAHFISHFPFTNIVWLADLSSKDPYYITPVLMGLSMFLQQKMSPTSGDPTQAKIMMVMPIFLTFIFLNFPAGLVVYFITNNLLSMFQQWLLLRKA